MSQETRAIEVCRRYVEAQELVKCLTRKIGAALFHCPLWGKDEHGNYAEGHDAVHLRRAMRAYNTRGYLQAACEHCLAAYDLIQQRKQARQAFARAKAMITRIGRSK